VDDRLTIVVISRNRREDLLRSLAVHAALPERPRVVFVDNASTDRSPDAVREAFPDVDVVELPRNLGGAARNVAVRDRVETPYVAFCDDDSWWEPGALAAAADLLDAHPRLAVVQGHILVGPEDRDDAICAEMARSPLPAAPGQPGHPLLSFVACAVVVRREAFLAVGGFHGRFSVGGEEELLGFDLAAEGWWMSYVPELVAHHHASPNRNRDMRRAIGIRNTIWTTWLRRPLWPALRRTARELLRMPRDRVTLRGLGWAVAGAPWVLRERRPSPAHVERFRMLLEEQQLSSESRRHVS
jgi:N-acetylglucosaminyl-diphospho-decaprenol L-rhamnosyltransferase